MSRIARFRNRLIARIIGIFPSVAKVFTASHKPLGAGEDIPWTRARNRLRDSKMAVVTTAGVHHRDQLPFNMEDPNGDPTFRVIDVRKPLNDLMITHDYYDHRDADKDINIVFPVERLRDFEKEGFIGRLADTHYGFMGHIVGPHIDTLIHLTAPEVAESLKSDKVDMILLTPG
jgi:D-proline reductase (dithiol) PrdB